MKRRQFLGALCSTVALGAGSTVPGPSVVREPFRFDPAADEPFATIQVGNRQHVEQPEKYGPHTVDIWNAGRTRRLHVEIDGRWKGNHWTIERRFPTSQYLQIELLEPDEYRIAVGERESPVRAVPVGRSWFDCNASGTNIRVGPNGNLKYSGHSTLLQCESSWSPNETDRDDTLIRPSRR